jgi:tetratricopeptide (TPR) repeat protein
VSNEDPDDQSLIGLARAQMLFQAGQIDASYQLAESLLKDLQRRGVANSIVVRLQIGLGAIRGRQGRYLDAVAQHEEALNASILLGNDTFTTQACVNLAVCYGRLGRYEDQLACALNASKTNRALNLYFTHAQLNSSLALSLAALGRLDSMRLAVDECDRRLHAGVDTYIRQAWFLWKADALAVAGLFEEASRVGAHAILGYDMQLLCTTVAGAFARWLAVTCDEPPHRERAAIILSEMEADLESFDALDQIEVLSARLWHGCDDVEWHLEELHKRTNLMPETALVSLRVCGIPVGF